MTEEGREGRLSLDAAGQALYSTGLRDRMEGIGLGVSAGISGVTSLLSSISEQIEYWKNYKGERIRIESVSHQYYPSLTETKETRYMIEGRITKVMSFPPGFMLQNVSERVVQHGVGRGFQPPRKEEYPLKESERRFISFGVIEQLEFIDSSED